MLLFLNILLTSINIHHYYSYKSLMSKIYVNSIYNNERNTVQNFKTHTSYTTCTSLHALSPETSDNNDDMNWDPKSAPKLDFKEDYYKVLEVPSSISKEDLKKAYYKVVFEYHPDRKKTKEEKLICNRQMMVINNAYKTLKDESLRKQYDMQRSLFGNSYKSSYSSTSSSSSSSSTTKETERKRYNSVYDYDDDIFNTDTDNDNDKESSSTSSPFNKNFYTDFANSFDYFQSKQQREPPDIDDSSFDTDALTTDGIKNKIKRLRKQRDDKEALLLRDPTDWGSVTDRRRVQQRLDSIDECKRIDETITELQGELDYRYWQEKQSGQQQGRSSGRSGSSQQQVNDLWERMSSTSSSSGSGSGSGNTWADDDLFSEIFQERRPADRSEEAPTWRQSQAQRRGKSSSSSSSSTSSSGGSGGGGGSGGVDGRSGDDAVREELERLLRQMKRKS